MANMESLVYWDDPVSEQVYEATSDAAAQCGYDQLEEVLLDFAVLVGPRCLPYRGKSKERVG